MRAYAALCVLVGIVATQGCCGRETLEVADAPIATGPAPTAYAPGDWPNFRGPNNDGIAPDTGINKDWGAKAPTVLWQNPMTDGGYSGPAVALGMVFIVDHKGADDTVRAWRLADGKEVWSYTYPDADRDNRGFSRSTAAFADGRLFVVSRLGKVHCFDAKTGKIVWQKDLVADFGGQRPTWDYACSPIVDGDKVILTPGANDAGIVALEAKTGNLVFKGGSGAPGYATPVIATIGGVRQYVVFLARKLCGLDTATGKELWSYPWVTPNDVNAATPLVIGDSVFISSGYGKGCAMVDVKNGQATLRWQNRAMQAHFSSPILSGGKIYGTGDPGVMLCMDPADGSVLWRQPGFEKGAIVGVDGTIIGMNGSNGEIVQVRLDPSSYQEMGRFAPLRGQAWTAPIIVDKKAIVRTTTAIAVVDLG